MTRTVRTTMQPDREIEVGDAEYLDLHRMGLLVEGGPTSAEPAATTPPAATPKKTSGTAGTKEN
jgi:hypothetical protein